LATGIHTVVIDAEKDYERASQGVYIVQALRGGSAGIFTVDFRLKLKSNDDAKAEVVDSSSQKFRRTRWKPITRH